MDEQYRISMKNMGDDNLKKPDEKNEMGEKRIDYGI